ncbi:MAG: tetratricopeptide repeat protein [Candidatus Acidiferrales bacterium]
MTPFSKTLFVVTTFLAVTLAPSALVQTVSTSRKTYHAQPAEDPALRALLAKGQAALQQKDYATAIDAFSNYIAKKPEGAEGHFWLGYAYSAAAEPEKAIEEDRKAVALDPNLAEAFQNLGLALLDKDPRAAVEPFRKLAELKPELAQAHFVLGTALERSAQIPEAIGEYKAAEKLEPKSFDTHFALGRANLSVHEAATAEAEFREALEADPDSAIARLGLAQSLMAQGKKQEAATELGRYLGAMPGDVAARLDRAGLLYDLGEYSDAMAELDRLDAAAAPSLVSLRLRGEILFQQKKYAEAVTPLQKAAVIAPDDPILHAQLGHVLLESKNYPAAIPHLLTACKNNLCDLSTVEDLMAAEYLGGNYSTALKVLDALEKKQTLPAGSWYIRADCLDKLGQKKESLAAYQKFLELNAGQNNDEYFAAAARVRTLAREIKEKK